MICLSCPWQRVNAANRGNCHVTNPSVHLRPRLKLKQSVLC
jgi:hypothetical protein